MSSGLDMVAALRRWDDAIQVQKGREGGRTGGGQLTVGGSGLSVVIAEGCNAGVRIDIRALSMSSSQVRQRCLDCCCQRKDMDG